MTSSSSIPRILLLGSCLSILASCGSDSDGSPIVEPQILQLEIEASPTFRTGATLTLVPIDARHGDATLSAFGVSLPATYEVHGSRLRFAFDDTSTGGLPATSPWYDHCADTLRFLTLELHATVRHGTIASVTGTGTGIGADWWNRQVPFDQEYSLSVVSTDEDTRPRPLVPSLVDVHPLDFRGVWVDGSATPDEIVIRRWGVMTPVETLAKTTTSLRTTTLPGTYYPSTSTRPLDWGATYGVETPGDGATDVLGRRVLSTSFNVSVAPPPFTSPGFEGVDPANFLGANVVKRGPAEWFMRAVEGEQALGLGAGTRTTLTFAGPPASELVLRVRYEQDPEHISLGLTFFETGYPIVRAQANAPSGFTGTGDEIAEIRVPLPPIATDGAFALAIDNPREYGCRSVPAPYSSVVIEELRVE